VNRQLVITALIILTGFGAVFFLTRYIQSNRIALPETYSDSDLDLQGKRLKGFALGGEGLLADWYWMRSLQYMGGKISSRGLENLNLEDMTALNPRLLYPMLDNATTLDPKLMAAYSYGATVLPAIDAKQAIELTEKGIIDNPDQWRLLQYLGYIHWRLKDYEKAAQAYDRGAHVPGAPLFFKLMVAKMRSESGSRDTAREIYKQAVAEAPDGRTKRSAQLRLYQLDAFDELDVTNKVLGDHLARTGRCFGGWSEALPALETAAKAANLDLRVDASRNLVDPSGVPYRLNRQKCQGEIDWPASKIPTL
jgi:tetratricopeptide (TPR) repeat protein